MRVIERARRARPAIGARAKAVEAPSSSAVRPARNAANAEPGALVELFQVKAWVRTVVWTVRSLRTLRRTSVGGIATSVITTAARNG